MNISDALDQCVNICGDVSKRYTKLNKSFKPSLPRYYFYTWWYHDRSISPDWGATKDIARNVFGKISWRSLIGFRTTCWFPKGYLAGWTVKLSPLIQVISLNRANALSRLVISGRTASGRLKEDLRLWVSGWSILTNMTAWCSRPSNLLIR